MDPNASYGLALSNGYTGIGGNLQVDSIIPHPNYNDKTFENNIAVVMLKPNPAISFTNLIADWPADWHNYQFVHRTITDSVPYFWNEPSIMITNGTNSIATNDNLCSSASPLYAANKDNFICNIGAVTYYYDRKCNLPYGTVYGAYGENVAAAAIYSHSAISGTGGYCGDGSIINYYTIIRNYIAWANQVSGMQVSTFHSENAPGYTASSNAAFTMNPPSGEQPANFQLYGRFTTEARQSTAQESSDVSSEIPESTIDRVPGSIESPVGMENTDTVTETSTDVVSSTLISTIQSTEVTTISTTDSVAETGSSTVVVTSTAEETISTTITETSTVQITQMTTATATAYSNPQNPTASLIITPYFYTQTETVQDTVTITVSDGNTAVQSVPQAESQTGNEVITETVTVTETEAAENISGGDVTHTVTESADRISPIIFTQTVYSFIDAGESDIVQTVTETTTETATPEVITSYLTFTSVQFSTITETVENTATSSLDEEPVFESTESEPESSSSAADEEGDNKPPSGLITGLIIALVLFILLLIGLLYYLCIYRKRKQREQDIANGYFQKESSGREADSVFNVPGSDKLAEVAVSRVKAHPNYNPNTFANNIAFIQFSETELPSALIGDWPIEWQNTVLVHASLNNDQSAWNEPILKEEGAVSENSKCSDASTLYSESPSDYMCSTATHSSLYDRDCVLPYKIAMGYDEQGAAPIGLYSHSATSDSDAFCGSGTITSYYILFKNYIPWFNQEVGTAAGRLNRKPDGYTVMTYVDYQITPPEDSKNSGQTILSLKKQGETVVGTDGLNESVDAKPKESGDPIEPQESQEPRDPNDNEDGDRETITETKTVTEYDEGGGGGDVKTTTTTETETETETEIVTVTEDGAAGQIATTQFTTDITTVSTVDVSVSTVSVTETTTETTTEVTTVSVTLTQIQTDTASLYSTTTQPLTYTWSTTMSSLMTETITYNATITESIEYTSELGSIEPEILTVTETVSETCPIYESPSPLVETITDYQTEEITLTTTVSGEAVVTTLTVSHNESVTTTLLMTATEYVPTTVIFTVTVSESAEESSESPSEEPEESSSSEDLGETDSNDPISGLPLPLPALIAIIVVIILQLSDFGEDRMNHYSKYDSYFGNQQTGYDSSPAQSQIMKLGTSLLTLAAGLSSVLAGSVGEVHYPTLFRRNGTEDLQSFKGAVLLKNGEQTSCEVALMYSTFGFVSAACLDYTDASAKTINTTTNYEVAISSGLTSTYGRFRASKVTPNPGYDPVSYANNIALVEFESNGSEFVNYIASWRQDWVEFYYTRRSLSNAASSTWNSPATTMYNAQPDLNACAQANTLFMYNQKDLICNELSTPSIMNASCSIPYASIYGVNDPNAAVAALYSHSAVENDGSLCGNEKVYNYFIVMQNYVHWAMSIMGKKAPVFHTRIPEYTEVLDPGYSMIIPKSSVEGVAVYAGDLYHLDSNPAEAAEEDGGLSPGAIAGIILGLLALLALLGFFIYKKLRERYESNRVRRWWFFGRFEKEEKPEEVGPPMADPNDPQRPSTYPVQF
ncbi:hypothetical protein IWW42_002808 [Coemansia sp. RSA 1085]|nr:hypothetical protein IWW42_002808 [Coemansia sp. RSA 1085]